MFGFQLWLTLIFSLVLIAVISGHEAVISAPHHDVKPAFATTPTLDPYNGYGKKVLIVGPLDTGSHILSMAPFAKALAAAGYNVSVFEWNYTAKTRDLGPGIRMLHIHEHMDQEIKNKRAVQTFVGTFDSFQFLQLLSVFNLRTPKWVYDHSEIVAELMSTDWDYIVLDEIFTPNGFGIAEFHHRTRGTPYSVYSTSQMMHCSAAYYGIVDHNFASNNYLVGAENFDYKKFLRESTFALTDFYSRWAYPQPELNTFKSTATRCPPAKPLPEDLQEFVDDPTSKGTIYIAFGTNVDWSHAPPSMISAFFDAVEALADYRVIFAYNGDDRNVSCHVRLLHWAPQFDILAHERTKVYVTHGGLKSTKEAVCTKVPVVYMPLYAEQTYNAHLSTVMGFALPLNKFNIDAKIVETAIRKVATDPSYKHNIERSRALAFDRIMPAMDEALFYVGRAIRTRDHRISFTLGAHKVSWFHHLYGGVVVTIIGCSDHTTNNVAHRTVHCSHKPTKNIHFSYSFSVRKFFPRSKQNLLNTSLILPTEFLIFEMKGFSLTVQMWLLTVKALTSLLISISAAKEQAPLQRGEIDPYKGYGKKVLIIGPLDVGSHILSMAPFAKALVAAGYNVTVFEWNYTEKARDLGPGIRMIHIHEQMDGAIREMRAKLTFVSAFDGAEFVELMAAFNPRTRKLVFEHSEAVVELMSTEWDLIIADEMMTPNGYGIAEFHHKNRGTPYAIYSTTQMMHSTASYYGAAPNLVIRPNFVTRDADCLEELYNVRNFWHRLVNVLDGGAELMGNVLFDGYFATNNYLVGADHFDYKRFTSGASISLTDRYTRWAFPIPGTVYIAFGTNVNWAYAPQHVASAFFDAIENLKNFRILFVYNGPPRKVSAHIRLLKWAPQFDILAHNKTKVYVTHGGLKSTKEAVCASVPVIYMPLYAEQTYNAHLSAEMGFALPLNKFTISAEIVESSIRKVATEPSFRQNIQRSRSLAFDRIMPTMDEAIFYVGRAMRTRDGRISPKTGAHAVSWLQHFYAEIIFILIIILYILSI